MTPEAQRIAIAEACGWHWEHSRMGGAYHKDEWIARRWQDLPDYLTDLNAMHDAEKVLTIEQQYTYGETLARMVQQPEIDAEKKMKLRRKNNNALFMPNGHGWFSHAHLTAAQRAEAFLRALSLWTE